MTTFALPRSFIPHLSKDKNCNVSQNDPHFNMSVTVNDDKSKEVDTVTANVEINMKTETNKIPEVTKEILEPTNEPPDTIQEISEMNESEHEETAENSETNEISKTITEGCSIAGVEEIPESIDETNEATKPIEDINENSETSSDIEIDKDGIVTEHDSSAKHSDASASVLEVEISTNDFKSFADKYTIKELRDFCKSKKLNVQGKKLDLAERYLTSKSNDDDIIICSS